MAFEFTVGQRQQLLDAISGAQSAFLANQNGTGIFSAAYDLLLDFISYEVQLEVGTSVLPAEGVDEAVWTWIGGAKAVNENSGGFAHFIRDYTSFQYDLRYGVEMPADLLQFASNQVSMNFFNDLRVNLDPLLEHWTLPSLNQVGQLDAGAAATAVFWRRLALVR